MFTDTQVQKEMLPVLTRETLDTALELFSAQTGKGVLARLSSTSYQLLHCQESHWTYGGSEGGVGGSVVGLQSE